jgi:hypothetical protein
MFVLTVVVSIPLAWVGYSLNWIRERHKVLDGGLVWDASFFSFNERPTAPAGLWLFGERGRTVISCPPIDGSHEYRERARQLFPEAELW